MQTQIDEESSAPSKFLIKTPYHEIPTTDDESLEQIQVTNAYNMLNHFKKTSKDKTKTKQEKKEDEIELFGRLLAVRLRKLPRMERQEVMYEIDGIFLDRCRNMRCASSQRAITNGNFSDSDDYESPADFVVSERSSTPLNNIVEEVFRSPLNCRPPEESYSSAVSYDYESFASYATSDSNSVMQGYHGLKICNNMTCDETQTYVRNYLPPGLLFECE